MKRPKKLSEQTIKVIRKLEEKKKQFVNDNKIVRKCL